MSTQKILIGAGTVILITAGGLITGRAGTKFANANGLYCIKSGVCTLITTAINTAKLTTGSFFGCQATITTTRTPVSGEVALWANNTCTAAVHFRF